MSEKTEPLQKTSLFHTHVDLGAKMVPFAGFSMPVQYSGLMEEHRAVREAVGLFDVSHMGEVELRGPRAAEIADRIVTNHIGKLSDMQACYTMMCKPDGGVVDDLVLYRFSAERIFICVNAANREKDFEWMKSVAQGGCEVLNFSDDYAQIAVQGPKAEALLSRLTPSDLASIKRYWFTTGGVAGKGAIIARTGYTGEDGFELYVAADHAPHIWGALMESGEDLGVKPAGLGARDSLRLEMCYALYGNDIDETTNPLEAGLGWTVKLKKPTDFVGKDTLLRVKSEGPSRRLIGFEVTGRGIARQGYNVIKDGQTVGVVTSGTMSPTLGKAVGLAYVPTEHASTGTDLEIEIRSKPVAARVVDRPFLRR